MQGNIGVWLFALGVAAGIVIVLALRAGIAVLAARRGALSGTWEQVLVDSRGSDRAKDRVACRQSGSEVRGTIRRVEPTVEDYKEWRFAGHIEGTLVSCVFWGADPQRTPGEVGTFQLSLVESGRADGRLVRQQVSQNGKQFTGVTVESKLSWTRPGVASPAEKMSPAQAAEAHKSGAFPAPVARKTPQP